MALFLLAGTMRAKRGLPILHFLKTYYILRFYLYFFTKSHQVKLKNKINIQPKQITFPIFSLCIIKISFNGSRVYEVPSESQTHCYMKFGNILSFADQLFFQADTNSTVGLTNLDFLTGASLLILTRTIG